MKSFLSFFLVLFLSLNLYSAQVLIKNQDGKVFRVEVPGTQGDVFSFLSSIETLAVDNPNSVIVTDFHYSSFRKDFFHYVLVKKPKSGLVFDGEQLVYHGDSRLQDVKPLYDERFNWQIVVLLISLIMGLLSHVFYIAEKNASDNYWKNNYGLLSKIFFWINAFLLFALFYSTIIFPSHQFGLVPGGPLSNLLMSLFPSISWPYLSASACFVSLVMLLYEYLFSYHNRKSVISAFYFFYFVAAFILFL